MKYVKYIYENGVEVFETTLQNTLVTIEGNGFELVSVQVLSDSHGVNDSTHSAYIIYKAK